MEKRNELRELAMPLVKYLFNNYSPHHSIVITDNSIRLVNEDIGIPVREVEIEEESINKITLDMCEKLQNLIDKTNKLVDYEIKKISIEK